MDKRLLISWVNAGIFVPPNGWKPSGLEYRIMSEAGIVQAARARDPDGVGETMVKCADILAPEYNLEIKALHEYARSGFRIASVKKMFKTDTKTAHRYIHDGWLLMYAAYSVMKSISYVNERLR